MDGVGAPFGHVFPDPAEDVSVTEPPEQKVVEPLFEIVGADGVVFTVTVVPAEAGDVQPFAVAVTV